MHDDELCNLVKRYQGAVWAYHEAVDRLTAESFPRIWERAERARDQVAFARSAVLRYQHQHAAAGGKDEFTIFDTEELVLGDQGQSGG